MNIPAGIPDDIAQKLGPLLQALVEGRVKQMVFVAELDGCEVLDSINLLDEDANRYVMVGALDCVKRDYMRMQMESRVEYAMPDDEDED